MTDIISSFMANRKSFSLPINLAMEPTPQMVGSEGQPYLILVQITQEVISRGRDVLNLLNGERRKRHQGLKMSD